MKKFVEFHDNNGPVFINRESIACVCKSSFDEDRTTITIIGDVEYCVREPLEAVIARLNL